MFINFFISLLLILFVCIEGEELYFFGNDMKYFFNISLFWIFWLNEIIMGFFFRLYNEYFNFICLKKRRF